MSPADSPLEIIRAWISTASLVGLLGLAGRMWLQNRRLELKNRELGMQEKVEDRQGYGDLIKAMGAEINRLRERIETLETERAGEHALIVELLRQTNRTQAVSIMGRADVSPELRRALETTISGTDTTQ